MRGAKKGLKIIVGTVPIFIMAGFIEGFITRHTELPDVLRLGNDSIVTVIYYLLLYLFTKQKNFMVNHKNLKLLYM